MKRPDWLKLSPPMVFSLIVLGLLGLGWLVVYLPQRQTASLSQKVKDYEISPKPDPKDLATLEKGQIDSENAIRTGLIQGLGGTAVLIGIYFTYRNLKVAEDKQVTERFSKAVEMLSSANIHTRLGGIYALERIAKDSDDDYWQVMEVLTAFVREESPWPPKDAGSEDAAAIARSTAPVKSEGLAQTLPFTWKRWGNEWLPRRQAWLALCETLPPLRTDVQAAMTVISQRKYRYEPYEYRSSRNRRLNLQKTDLRRLSFDFSANLTGVNFAGARFIGADLSGVDLTGANLLGVDLSDVWGLNQEQLREARTDNHTRLPALLPPRIIPPPLLPETTFTRNAALSSPEPPYPDPVPESQPPTT